MGRDELTGLGVHAVGDRPGEGACPRLVDLGDFLAAPRVHARGDGGAGTLVSETERAPRFTADEASSADGTVDVEERSDGRAARRPPDLGPQLVDRHSRSHGITL